MSYIIAIVEDEPAIVELFNYHLKKEKFKTEIFYSPDTFLKYLGEGYSLPHLIILDVTLSEKNGFQILKYLKKNSKFSNIPIIMLISRKNEEDKIKKLGFKVEDYITKSFSIKELVSKIKAILKKREEMKKRKEKIVFEDLVIYPEDNKVILKGRKISLSKTEMRVLKVLVDNFSKILKRDKIMKMVGIKSKNTRALDVHITSLRKKLKGYGKFIKSIRGVGYKFDLD